MRDIRVAIPMAACLLIGVGVSARAEEVTELWRNPVGKPQLLALNSADRSLWVSTGSSAAHIAADGTVLLQKSGLSPVSISVYPADGSWWAADLAHGRVSHYSAVGDPLWSSEDFLYPEAVAVNPADGSCWVGDGTGGGGGGESSGRVVHLSPLGVPLSSTDVYDPGSLAVNPADGSCWVGRRRGLDHVSATGEVLWSYTDWSAPRFLVAVDPTDGSCWAGDYTGYLRHLASDGTALWGTALNGAVRGIAVNPADGSCWAAAVDTYLSGENNGVFHFSRDGEQLWFGDQFDGPGPVAVDPADGSCWVGEWMGSRLTRLAADGTELWSAQGYQRPSSLCANRSDHSVWFADRLGGQVAHLSDLGEELWSSAGAGVPIADCLSVDSADGSCWLADVVGARAIRLSEAGTERWSGQVLDPAGVSYCYPSPALVASNPSDGSAWVIDRVGRRLLHLSAGGEQLWVGTDLPATAVAVNAHDGSCWWAGGGQVAHLSALGEELWSGQVGSAGSEASSLSVNERDGSIWVSRASAFDAPRIMHLAVDGRMLWSGGDFASAWSVAVDPVDGSCWVADNYGGRIAHLSATGEEIWSAPACCPVAISLDFSDGSLWLSECGSGQIVRFAVPQATHSFYLTANTPDPPTVPSGGTTSLSAIAVDTPDHGVASWSWSDGDAGGTFSPSASAAAPVYTAPRNFTGAGLLITLTVTAVCNGDPPLTASTSVTLTVGTEYALHLSRSGLGSVQVNGATQRLPWMDYFQPGTAVSLVAVASPGYELDRWTGDASGTGAVTLTMDRDYAVGAEFALIPGTAYSFPVDYPEQESAGWTGWASVSGAGWEWGAPVAGGGQPIGDDGAILGADPGAAHTGDTVIGYVIGGNYQAGMSPQYLTTPPLDFRGRQNVSLHFWRWLAVDDQAYDTAAVEVNAGSGWQRLWTNPTGSPPIYIFDDAWTEVEYPLPQADGKSGVQVRWQMGGSDTWGTPTEYGGWSLDDISFACDADRWGASDASALTILLWEEQTGLSAEIGNAGESTWDDSFGLQCLAEHTPTAAWDVEFVPTAGTVAPTESYTFSADITAPPVTTISYLAPVEWPAVGQDATLSCEWALGQEALGVLRGEPFGWDITISRFRDIQPGTDGGWARFYVEELAGAVPLIVAGYGERQYRPELAVTRDQMAVYIARAAGLDASGATGDVFRDVPADWWAAGAIEACAAAGIVSGFPDSTYQPQTAVTRDAMCKFIANGRAYTDPGFFIPDEVPAGAPFSDIPADHWAARWISACLWAGIVQGYSDGTYRPEAGVNRGQMAVFVWRAFLRDRESVVALGGPAISRYAPTVQRYAVGSVTSAEAGETLHASVSLDAVRLAGSPLTVRFDLKQTLAADTFSPAGSFTVTLDADQVAAAHETALASGNPYLPLTITLPTAGLEPGAYLLVTSINDVELARQVPLAITTAIP